MADADVNVRDLVERLWEQADAGILEGEPVLPPLLDFDAPEHDGDLRYLNTHWSIDPASEGPGVGPEWKSKAKDRLAATVFSILERYLEQEREFFAHGVRVSNLLAGWSTRLAREVRTVAEAVNDESHRLRDRQDLLHRRLEERIVQLEGRVAELEGRP